MTRPRDPAQEFSTILERTVSRALVAPPAMADDGGPFAAFAGLRATFVAHLIATRNGFPQTRKLRREGPEAAIVAYGAPRSRPGVTRLSRKV